jgi:hypothetical protein
MTECLLLPIRSLATAGGARCRWGLWWRGDYTVGAVEDLVVGAAASLAGLGIDFPGVSDFSAAAAGLSTQSVNSLQ